MKIHCHHCDTIFDMDEDDWDEHMIAHANVCEWFRSWHDDIILDMEA